MPLKLHPPGSLGKFWTVRGTIGTRRFWRSTKTTVKSQAEALRLQWETELETRRIYGKAVTSTFAEAVVDYIKHDGDTRFLSPLLELFGTQTLAQIGQSDLDDAARALYPKAQPSTLNRQAYTPFIAVYNHAAQRDMAPCKQWTRPRGHDRNKVLRFLWPQEVEACIAAAAPHGRAVLELFVATGFREQEGVGLEWRDVRLITNPQAERGETYSGEAWPPMGEAWTWRTKTDVPRRVDLFPRTVGALSDLKYVHGITKADEKAGARVLRNEGGAPFVLQPNGGGALRTLLNRIAEAANVEPFGAHILRHTWATWRYASTLDLLDLKAAGGWKGSEAERYAHLAPRTLANELYEHGWNSTIFQPAKPNVHEQFSTNADISKHYGRP